MERLTKTVQDPILIVDDNSNNLKVLSQALRHAGWTVAIAKNGETALKQVKHTPPTLILLDVMMPGMDGFETCQKIKENPEMMDIPVIFMTALSDTVDKVKGLSIGAVDYITKPFQTEEVLARVSVHYNLRYLTKQLEEQNQFLEQRVAEKTAQLVQHEKMAALGNLVAGIAHEINNPVGFIAGNINAAQDYTQNLFYLLKLYRQELSNPSPELQEAIDDLDLEFIEEDLPKLISSMRLGVDRIRNISTSLRTFSRADTNKKTEFNLQEGIDSTLLILKYRLKANENRPAIQVVKDCGESPPLIKCYAGQLNQVIMNIVANAIDALEESNQGRSYQEIEGNPNKIFIRLEELKEKMLIRIRDNGTGMSEEVRDRIFESMFTTKSVGKGTGLGLAIARQIVEEKHGGMLTCHSQLGKGTEFVITLPLQ